MRVPKMTLKIIPKTKNIANSVQVPPIHDLSKSLSKCNFSPGYSLTSSYYLKYLSIL